MTIGSADHRAERYQSYVGPADRYDFIGASQFRLLCALGLRANHSLLDFGCGSLRAGRLLISYLDEGRYYGIEPNQWLIDASIQNQVGADLIRIKRPTFDNNSDFRANVFSRRFDFILVQSIFSHTGPDLMVPCLTSLGQTLAEDGVIAATFSEARDEFEGNGWVYPGVARYRSSTIRRLVDQTGLHATAIPWYHPGQFWYLLAKTRERLPRWSEKRYLCGAVLSDRQFADSRAFFHYRMRRINAILPTGFKTVLKNMWG